jgi:hypothetical protein
MATCIVLYGEGILLPEKDKVVSFGGFCFDEISRVYFPVS